MGVVYSAELVRLRGGGEVGMGEVGKDGAMFSLFQSPWRGLREVRARLETGEGSGVRGGEAARLQLRRVCIAVGGGEWTRRMMTLRIKLRRVGNSTRR